MVKRLIVLSLLVLLPYSVASAFTDVTGDAAIDYLQEQKIVEGYDDGSFRPENPIARSEFVALVVRAFAHLQADESKVIPFPDVPMAEWFYTTVKIAADNDIISGDSETGNFEPYRKITYAEAAKVIVLAAPNLEPKVDIDGEWFWQYLLVLDDEGLGLDVDPGTELNRRQMAQLIYNVVVPVAERVPVEVVTEPVAELQQTYIGASTCLDDFMDPAFAQYHERLAQVWVDWYNEERAKRGYGPLQYSEALSRTSYVWAEESKRQGVIGHRRTPESGYYNYREIEAWFANLGVRFGNKNRTTFVENLGRAYITCDLASGACEDQLIGGMRTVIDMFLGEESWASRPHFEPFVNANYDSIGVGLSYNPATSQLYVVTHFGVEVQDSYSCN